MDERSVVRARLAAVVVLAAMVLVSFASVVLPSRTALETGDSSDESPLAAVDAPTVVFGAVGDFDNKAPSYPDMVALAKRLGNRGGMFLLALGDLGYVSDEQQWCGVIKGAFSNTLVVAGNHDTTESGPGDINNDVIYCPFNVAADLVPGPTYGYGKSYYFDYPKTTPLVRVIMITAGTTGTQVSGQNYGTGGAEFNWVSSAVGSARSSGIPWVVVGLHKMCITVGTKTSCEMGQAIFNKVVDLKVDLVLQGHDHVYERSKQLALSVACPSVLAGGQFDPDCVVASGPNFTKGNGPIVVVDGAGGRDLYTVHIDGSDKEIGYFDVVMGTNANTQGKANGHGPIVVSLNATTLAGTTTFCPLGTGDVTTGECPSKVASTFSDSFTISSTGGPPPPLTADFGFTPSSPSAGQTVTFSGSAGGGTPPYTYAWQFGDGAIGSGATTTHAYPLAGTYVANLTITDAASFTARASKVVVVSSPSPPGSPTASLTFSPAWPQTGAPVTFNASASSDPDPGATLEVRWDWTNDGTFDTAWSTDRVATHAYPDAGTPIARLEVRDDTGLTDNATASVPVDGAPPMTSASLSGTLGQNGWYRGSVTATLTATDDVSGVAATWNRRDNASWNLGTTVTFTSDRVHTLDYYSTDRSGRSESARTLVIAVDQTPPVTSSTLEGTQDPYGSYVISANLTLSASDGLSGVADMSYRIDGGVWQAYTSRILVTGAGPHVVAFFATDVAGNTESGKSVSFTIAGSSSPPVTTLSVVGTLGSNGWYLTSVTATLTAVSPDGLSVTIYYRLDGGPWIRYTSPFQVSDGAHAIDYNATDAASAQEGVRTATIEVDAVAPVTSAAIVGTHGRDHWFTSPATVTLTAADGTSGVASTVYRLDGLAWTRYVSPLTVGNGRHLLEYGSVDAAGNAEIVASASIKVDTSPPRINLASTPGVVTVSQVSLVWNETDDVAGVVDNGISVDGRSFVSLGLNQTTTLSLADGTHSIRVSATDDAGNVAIAEIAVRVDTNPFSPSGPYSGVPLYFLVEFAVVLTIVLVWRRRSRRKRQERQRALRRMRKSHP